MQQPQTAIWQYIMDRGKVKAMKPSAFSEMPEMGQEEWQGCIQVACAVQASSTYGQAEGGP